ncbi:MAG: hypothetical protein M1365_11865 [Actinobacteria bacterium]|nr:hypothetical protein [Actinomycetota bacterium]
MLELGRFAAEEIAERFGLRRNGYKPGEWVGYVRKELNPDGTTAHFESMDIDKVAGGGFGGKVLIPKEGNFVIKTSRPDSFHELARCIAWGFKPFPTQVSERAAQLEHISTRLIHKVIPVLTGGKFYSPDSLGYAKLLNGYAQVVEKVEGRGPKFDVAEDEPAKFKQAQKEIAWLALNLGLEHAGQVHPDNPFAMANLWYDDINDRWIWMDTIPAIPHNLPYKFHRQIREWFNMKHATFNRIHTGYFIHQVAQNRHLFSDREYEEIKSMLVMYDTIWEEHAREQAEQKRDFKPAARALGKTVFDAVPKAGRGAVKLVSDPVRLVFSEKFRREEVLKGVNTAKERGLINETEWEQALKIMDDPSIKSEDKAVIGGLLGYYGTIYGLMKIAELSGYTKAIVDHDAVMGGAVFIGGIVVPPALRYLGTKFIGRLTNRDLEAAAIASAIPTLGNILPIPAQMAYFSGTKSRTLWHYTVRHAIAKLSQITPQGGWTTEFEAKLWKKIGKRLEKLAKFTEEDTNNEQVLEEEPAEITEKDLARVL